MNESIFGEGALRNQERERQVDEGIIQAHTLEEESITCAEVQVQIEDNASYLPSTNFIFAANPAYGTDVAIAPEIPTEDNIAYQHACSSQLSSNPDDNTSSSSRAATQRNDSLVSNEY